MKQKNQLASFILALIMLFCALLPAVAEEAESKSAAQALIERLVISYAAYSERDGEALAELAAIDPALADQWAGILDLWAAPVTVHPALPEDLPKDDTLCLVALGFQLNPDGSMRDELVERLKVLLDASKAYPNAVIVCTGGGTAADKPSATEAGRMAEWLREQGVAPERIYVEDRSITTAQNAIFTFDILQAHCPQVNQIAIISSDYHIATGVLLFGAEAILRRSAVAVVTNAAWHAPSGTLSAMFQAGALIELSGDEETAIEIYYDTYDIHELPPLHSEALTEIPDGLTLDRVVVLSRHSIRSPMSGSGSLLGDLTPHTWFAWSSNPSELSLRGAMLEPLMGQYFRLWLEQEGLFPENYRPDADSVRFYANAKQRTLATARYFSAGLLPVADIGIENHAPYDTMDPTFNPVLTFFSEAYARDVEAQVGGLGGDAGIKGIQAGLRDAISLLMDVTDMADSEAYQAGAYGDLLSDETMLILEDGKEPGMKGPIKTATSVADALTLQYYEEPDAMKASFGHALTEADWQTIHRIVDVYTEMLFTVPLVA
ncbi:MAG: YdcF family protein, partial [Clostridia bacterium]|nr:YdcF family protein [Clostridia bacterium]